MENKKQELFSLVGFLRSAMESQQLIPIRLKERAQNSGLFFFVFYFPLLKKNT